MTEVKQEVRQFYDEIGWKLVGEDVYQNARYEDLRPVSRRYIHDCHLRVARHLNPTGRFLLDAGSGPVQYPEYQEYSRGYQYRVCADISITALKEARLRLAEKGLYVVADVANLPFKPAVFDGIVSLHTIHHLPEEEHLCAFQDLFRVLAPNSTAVVVNGWSTSHLMNTLEPLVRLANTLRHISYRLRGNGPYETEDSEDPTDERPRSRRKKTKGDAPKGTFTNKHDAQWVRSEVGALMPTRILVWRSVTVRFMRALIHPWLGGRFWLRLLYGFEERFPGYFGENGKYALIVIRKKEEAGEI
jgi:SAM-dependent methyltransferase